MTDRISKLKSMVEKDPRDSFCLYGLGMEYAKLEQHREAEDWFERAIDADPDHLYAYFHKARSLQARGDRSEAAQTLKKGLARAKAIGDTKAAGELSAFLDEVIGSDQEEDHSLMSDRMKRLN